MSRLCRPTSGPLTRVSREQEDDEDLVLAAQRGWQGMFTLYRDLFVKVIRNVDPAAPGLNETGSWKTRKETDGSTSVVTVSLFHI